MARNSKNKKIARKNKKLRYRKGGPARLDMRKGGRVALGKGGGSSSGSTDKSRREKNKEKRKQRKIDRRNARKSKSGEEAGTRESLPTPGDIAALASRSEEGPLGSEPPQTTGPRGTQNIPGPSGFDTYTAGPGSSPQQTAPGEPGIGSVGVDVNPNAPETTPPPPPPPPSDIAPVAPPGINPPSPPIIEPIIPDPTPPEDSGYVAPLIQDIGAPEGTGLGTPIEGRPSIVTPERGERIARSTERIERAARGELPLGTPIPAAQRVDPNIKMEATTMETVDDTPDRQAVSTEQDVTTGTVTTGKMPDTIDPATYDADEVLEQAAAVGQIGDLSEEATLTDQEIAQAANVDYEATISGADVEIPVGALQQEVTGTISSQSIAEAAKAAGTTGGRLTRAKKQLRKAG